jgi:hypothetical protein
MSTTAAKPPKPVRRGHGAVLIPVERLEEWYALAIATPGLNDVERGVLSAIAEHFRQLQARGYGMRLSYDRMAYHLNMDSVHVKWAVYRLLELGLIGVQSGRGGQANTYSTTLPRRVAKSILAAAADDTPPF